MSTSISQIEQNIETVTAFNDAVFDDQDLLQMSEYLADEFVQYDGDVVTRGLDEAEEYFGAMLETFPDISLKTYDIVAADDLVVFRCGLTGTNDGDVTIFEGETIPATGKTVEWDAMIQQRLENGKIVETHVFADDLAVLTQFGLVDDIAA